VGKIVRKDKVAPMNELNSNVLIENIKQLNAKLKEKEDRIRSMELHLQKNNLYLNSASQCINAVDDVFEYAYRFVSREKLHKTVTNAMANHTSRCRKINKRK
jgi:hypothetical protein